MVQACTHLDVMVPDNLKLWLHQAFWRHRRNCARCLGKVSQTSYAWKNCECALEDLITRPEPEVKEEESDTGKKISKTARPADPKALARAIARKLKDYEKRLAQGEVEREFVLDDDFDGGDTEGRKHIKVLVENHSKEDYDLVEEIDTFTEEIAEMIRDF